MEINKVLSMLGLCKKAGKLRQGFEAVKESAVNNEIYLILLSDEIAENTRGKAENVAYNAKIPLETIPIGLQKLGEQTGKKAGVLGIADQGFAVAITKLI